MSGATVKQIWHCAYPCNRHKSNTGLLPFCSSSFFITMRVQSCQARPEGKVISVIQTATNIVWRTAELLHIQSLLHALHYLTAFLVRQGISVIPICQKIIWVWMAYWTLHEKLHWLWFSSSSQCSLHNSHCVSGPSFKFITFMFWISTYHLHTNVQLAANISTAFKNCENSQKRCSSVLPALLHDSGSFVPFSVLPWICGITRTHH